MDELKASLGLSSLPEEWCQNMLKDDFCSENFPESWTYDNTLIGLEEPFRDLLKYIRKKRNRIWDNLIISDVSRIQCVTNVVLESCIKGEGSPLTGLLCGGCYLYLSTLEGASARNVFHNMLFGKVMELLKVQNDSSSFEGILAVYESLSEIIESDLTLPDQSYWILVKSFLASVNINCSHKKADNSDFNQLFSVILSKPKDFKFFIKEASAYLLAGKSYVSDRCSSLICDFTSKSSENKRVMAHHLNLIHTLCSSISDRTEARRQVEAYILKLVAVLPNNCFFEFVDWIVTQLCMSQKVVHRIFGAEMCFQLSFNDFVTDAEDPSVLKLLYHTIILGLRDKAPTVRAKCAVVLSDLLKNAPTTSQKSLLPYFEPSNSENILHVVQFLSSDEKSSVRKASCSLLLMMLLKIKVRSSWLKIIYRFCLDTAVSVRKQALMSVGQLLSEFESDPVVQRLWLETVLPATNDNENSVKDYCSLQLESLLNKLHSSDHAWEILQLISNPKSLDLQTYFDFGIYNLKDFKMSADCRNYLLQKLEDPQSTHTILLVVSKMVDKFKEIDSCQLIDIFERCLLTRSDDSYQTMCMSFTCLRNLKRVTDIDEIVEKLKLELKKFTHPYIVIKELVATVANLIHRTDKQQMITLCEETIRDIGVVLQNLCLTQTSHDIISSMKLCCYLFTLGEVTMHYTKVIDSTVILSVKQLIIGSEESSFSTSVRGHSIIALGKMCLVHEDVAKDSVMLFSKVLEDDKQFEIRNNILIVLGDLIVRYPTIIAEYLYCVTDCLQDESMVVRRQAIIVLTKLLQEDYLKWRSGIVMKFISNLVCENSEIRQLCELCLSNILLVRYPKTYFNFFIEVVFFANELFSFLTTTEPNLLHFSLPGQENQAKRRKIYTAMLQNLGDQQKLELTTRICKEVLTLFVAENDDPIDEKLIPLLHDSLWILCCPSLKLSSLKSRASHDFDDDDSNIGIIEAQTKLISTIVKRVFVENCTPIIIQLRQKLRRLKSPLQSDLTKFIVHFVTDFKNEIEVLSGADAQFIAEVQYDMDEFKKRESSNHAVLDSVLHETVVGNLMTPGFLKSFKTPHTGRGLNLSLANQGPAMFLNSPFFAAPTPHSLSRSVTYKRPQDANDVNAALRKNLLSDFRLKEATTISTIVVSQTVAVTKSTSLRQNLGHKGKQSQSDISVHTSMVHHEIEAEDNEISYTERTTTIKIVNSPVPSTQFVDNSQDVVGIKKEVQSPSEKYIKKTGRNLFNPYASANLVNASRMSENSINVLNESRDVPEDLLLTNKTEKGCVRIKAKMETAKKVLISSQQPQPSLSVQSNANQQPKKPLKLGDLIKEKIREQKRRKAQLAKANDPERISTIPEVITQTEPSELVQVKSETLTSTDSSEKPSGTFVPQGGESTEEGSVEPASELPEEGSVEPASEVPEEGSVEPASEVPEEGSVEPASEVPEEGSVEPASEVPEEGSVEPASEVPEEGSVEPAPEVPEESSVEPASEVPEESSVEPASEVPEEGSVEPASEVPVEVSVESVEQEKREEGGVESASAVPMQNDDNTPVEPHVGVEVSNEKTKKESTEDIDRKPDAEKRRTRRSARFNKLMNQFKPAHGIASSKEKVSSDQDKPSDDVIRNSGVDIKLPDIRAIEKEGPSSTENLENTPPRASKEVTKCSSKEVNKTSSKEINKTMSKEINKTSSKEDSATAKEVDEAGLAAIRRAKRSKILKQFQPKRVEKQAEKPPIQSEQSEKPPDPDKPSAPSRASKRVSKLLAQLQPKKPPGLAAGRIVDKPENILLRNQVLRKRKNPNDSGHCVYQEDDLDPKPKRRSIDNLVNLGNVTFDPHDPHLVASTPAVSSKGRRASERLMQRGNVSFNQSDPAITASTPFIPDKVVAKKIVSSTPLVTQSSSRLKMKFDLSPIREPPQKN